ncbi:MAG: DUF4139 domain-containing protein [Calditrichota bacterium]
MTAHAEIALTIYNQDLALVRETRELEFVKGESELCFTDVAAQIIPTSVHFSSPLATLLEQNYEYDLVDADKVLTKFIDRDIELISLESGVFKGTLLGNKGGIVMRESDGSIRSITPSWVANIHFPKLPEGLITRPTLVWKVKSPKGGKGQGEISYLTNGINWEAEYVAVVDDRDENLELTGWVNVTNNSGASYRDARLKLMAGDVKIESRRDKRDRRFVQSLSVEASAGSDEGFQEQPFYEYHLYMLPRPSTILDQQIKQLSLFPSANTPVKKEYKYTPGENNKKVQVNLEFQNRESVGLGLPLPKGKVRVYKEGPDGGLEFVGEDRIDHTPKDEKVRVSTGNAFDIVGESTQTDYQRRGNDTEREMSIKLRNHKKEAVEVLVVEYFGRDWTLLDGTTPGWTKTDANHAEWKITLKPDEEREVHYRVLQR